MLVADITDFYNQVSHHRIENALETAGVSSSRAKALVRFLGNLSARQSRGIPVGPTASILLAEACLNDVDSKLIRSGYIHSRFVDDFRIFCRSYAEAQRALHDLSEYLYTAHRLALHSYKTKIMTVERFRDNELIDPEKLEEQSKAERISSMLAFLSGYGGEPEDVTEDDINRLIRINLRDLFASCLEKRPLPLGLARFLLRRATRLRTSVLQEQVIDNLTKLLPVLRDAMVYLEKTTRQNKFEYVGESLIRYLAEADLSFIPYVKFWLIHLLTEKFSQTFEAQIIQICNQEKDIRHLGLMARNRNHLDWVREQKEIWNNYKPWEKRAIIWSAPVLPNDERRYWLRSIENAGDKLDYIVAKAAYTV